MFSKVELEDFWQNKPYGEFTRLAKSVKGKKKYKIRTTAYRAVEETIGTRETEVWAKDYSDAISRLNSETNRNTLMRELNLKSWDSSVKYKTEVVRDNT